MAEKDKPITYREKLIVRLLLLACQVVCGQSFAGGVPNDITEAIKEIREAI